MAANTKYHAKFSVALNNNNKALSYMSGRPDRGNHAVGQVTIVYNLFTRTRSLNSNKLRPKLTPFG